MSFTTFFASPTLKPISQSVIAALLFDIAKKNSLEFDAAAIGTLAKKAIDKSVSGIIRSELTKKNLLKSLQRKNLHKSIESFREKGMPLAENYFETRFSKVISKRNAAKIAPEFLKFFQKALVDDVELTRQVVAAYLNGEKNAEWELETIISEEIQDILGKESAEETAETPKVNGTQAKKAAAQHVDVDTEKAAGEALESHAQDDSLFNGSIRKTQLSGQMIYWEQHRHALPIRGLRTLERLFPEKKKLCITGFSGCGKSMLVSAFIYQQVLNHHLQMNNIFYFRFVEGISDYESLLKKLWEFFRKKGTPQIDKDFENTITALIVQSNVIFVFDDLQAVQDVRSSEFIEHIWRDAGNSDEFSGKLIVMQRDIPEFIALEKADIFHYEGLAVSESSALIRDVWKLAMPRLIAREIARKLNGNPERMQLFRNWFILERRTDTELQRYAGQMPDSDGTTEQEKQLNDYVAEHLYAAFERVDSRFNGFMKTASIFSVAEDEDALQKMYKKIGGGDFQDKLEDLVEKYDMLRYDDMTMRFKVPDTLREFYDAKLSDSHDLRVLYKAAGQIYQQRYLHRHLMEDAVLGAEFFMLAEKEDKALELIERINQSGEIFGAYPSRVLKLLKNINLKQVQDSKVLMNLLYNRARLYFRFNQIRQAEKDFMAVQAMQPSNETRAEIFYHQALIASAKGQTDNATHLLQATIEIYSELNDGAGIARTFSRLGDIFLVQEKLKPAEGAFRKAFALYEQMGDPTGELYVISQLAAIFRVQNKWELAFEFYQKSLKICEDLQDHTGMVQALNHIGQIYEIWEQLGKALAVYKQACEINEQIFNTLGIARAKERMGMIYYRQKRSNLAMPLFEEVKDICEQSHDLSGMASVYKNIGLVHCDYGNWEMAMEFYRQSQDIYEQLNDSGNYGQLFAHVAVVYREMGEYDRALDMYDKAIEVKERQGDSSGISGIYEEIGDIYERQGQRSYAVEVYQRSLKMRQNLNNLLGAAKIYHKMGTIYQTDQDWETAENYQKQALKIFSQLNHEWGLAKTYQALAAINHVFRDFEKAKEYYLMAITHYESLEDIKGMAEVNYQLGNLFYDMGDWERAINRYRTALPLFEEVGDLFNIAQVMGNASSIEFEQNDHISAIQKQIEILLYFHKTRHQELIERVLANLVACQNDLGEETFQALLNQSLEKITREGVHWGEQEVITVEEAAQKVNTIFYNS